MLVQDLALGVEDAVALIAGALRTEMESKHITLEILDLSSRAERASFLRGVVHRVQMGLEARREWPASRVKSAVESFMQMLHKSWESEHPE